MPYNINFDRLAIATGIATDRLKAGLSTYDAMARLFPMLEVDGHEVALYGGTALNKVYFGKRQRLSYDLDIYCYSYESTLKSLRGYGAVEVPSHTFSKGQKNSRFIFQNTRLDLWKAGGRRAERPAKRVAHDLLEYFNVLVPPVAVPTYSMEYLLANKTLTMAARAEVKDIYDTWIGLQLPRDDSKYQRYIRANAGAMGIKDYGFFIDSMMHTVRKNPGYYKDKRIDALHQPPVLAMVKDIAAALDL